MKRDPETCRCGQPIEVDRVEWGADTCTDCMAGGCPFNPADAEDGERCDDCDCMRPRSKR